MLDFKIDQNKCTRCELCVNDCPVRIIQIAEAGPHIPEEKESACLKCQHCLAICPTAAVSILGKVPEDSLPVEGHLPDPRQLETLIKGRRSVRSYRDENLDPQLLQRLLDVAWHAPTGVNARQVRLTVIDDRAVMQAIRKETMEALGEVVDRDALSTNLQMFAEFIAAWRDKGIDFLFRGAPHLLITSTPKKCPTPKADGLIALSYFELFAQSLGVGTVWDGLAMRAYTELVPHLQSRLGIPEDHEIGYMMAFGPPAVSYPRTVQHSPALIARIQK